MEAAEQSHAQEAMLSDDGAVGAYDHVPMASAAGVYTFDTASEVFMLHSAKVMQPYFGRAPTHLLLITRSGLPRPTLKQIPLHRDILI